MYYRCRNSYRYLCFVLFSPDFIPCRTWYPNTHDWPFCETCQRDLCNTGFFTGVNQDVDPFYGNGSHPVFGKVVYEPHLLGRIITFCEKVSSAIMKMIGQGNDK